METIAIIITICLVSVLLGDYLSVRLPLVDPNLDRKPFNCRPCTTFHLVWILCALASLVVDTATVFFGGIAAAFIVFAIVKFIDNKKIIK